MGAFLENGGAQAASDVIGTVANVFMAKAQRKQQEKLLKMQQDYQTKEREASQTWQEQMWRNQFNATNAYNRPSNYMRLLREAGLNPDLMYSGNGIQPAMMGSVPGSTASGAPSVPQVAGSENMAEAGQGLSDFALKSADIALKMSEVKKNEAETEYTNIAAEHEGKKIMLTGKQIEFTDEQKEFVKAKTQNALDQSAKFKSAIEVDKSVVALNQQELNELKSTFKDRFKQIRLTNRSIELNNKLTDKELAAFEDYMEAVLDLMNEQAFQAQQAGKNLSLSNIETSKIQEARNKISVKYFDGRETGYYETMASLSLALMIGDTEMVQTQAQLLQDYGAWKAIMDPIIQSIGIATGAYIGARTNKAPQQNNRPPIGFR